MRVVIMSFVAVAGFIGLAGPVQAAPAAPHDLAAPAITMVRQRCGEGMKRENAWRDKYGAWHGRCVPKRQ
jgi:hypothetical protein